MQIRRWQIAVCVTLCALLAWPAGTRADDKHPPKYKGHVHHQAKSFDLTKPAERTQLFDYLEKGEVDELELERPKINPIAFMADLGIWAIVIFLALLFILRKAAWGPMLEGLQKREDTIRSAVEEAKHARAETQRITAQFQRDMAEKMAEIPKIMEAARRDAEVLKEEIRAQSAKDVQTERERLRREIETARDQAVQELWHQAAQLATLISAKTIGRHISEDDHRRLVDEALNELTTEKKG